MASRDPGVYPSFEALATMVEDSPFHRWLGVRLIGLSDDDVTLELPWREEFVSSPGARYTHGGILAAFIDIAADYALAARLGRGLPTVDMRTDFHRMALPGSLTATGRVLRIGQMLGTAEARIEQEGKLVASGRGVFVTRPPKQEPRDG